MKRDALIESILLLILGLAGILEGIRLVLETDPQAVSDVLGPYFLVLVLGIILFLIGIIRFLLSRGKELRPAESSAEKGKRMEVVWMAAVFALYIPLLEWTGYLVASFFFFIAELRLAGSQSWKINFVLSGFVTGSFYVIFVKYCSIVFPRGVLLQGIGF